MHTLPEHPFRISYGPADDRVRDFYLPALERSVRYDRLAGYFSSGALAVAAAGIVRLIANGGRMRLLCGAQLSEADVEAVRAGEDLARVVERRLEAALPDPGALEQQLRDEGLQTRLQALSWMVAQGTLQIRVVLPRGPDGHPLPASRADDYFHPKEGVFEDREGNRLSFSGSSNESVHGWLRNYESFSTFASWPRQEGSDTHPATPAYIAQTEARFRELWEANNNPGWIALDLPEAARRRLLRYCPSEPPLQDPGEAEEKRIEDRGEALTFRFLLEAPFLPNAHRIGVETSTVRPWPHQSRVIQEAVRHFPQSFLFSDEVGLGKTIEAGLALRQLILSGRVERALILVPASILRQWQEELYEKCILNIPRLDRGCLLDVFDREVGDGQGNVWDRAPVLLASSQLAKRRERQQEVLAAGPWDLVLVDEAHHARRKDFQDERYRPNRLLELLMGAGGRSGLKDRTRCLYLLTATPMQVNPLEVWDLLRVLGMGGRWGALQENFLRYFEELGKPWGDRDWRFLMGMLSDALAVGGGLDPHFAEVAREAVGPVEWDAMVRLPTASNPRAHTAILSDEARKHLDLMLRRHTPLRSFVWRNTRALLRRYRERGILHENVPDRDPRPVWVPMTPEERTLYDRIEEYISDFYQKYEAERKGLGFVMTVYRRRLTSSFYAVARSLERRRDFLRGALPANEAFTEEDLEQEELGRDVSEELGEEARGRFQAELAYVEDFLHQLRMLGGDSKVERLERDLQKLFQSRETVIVFTQYTDTMDHLRDRLKEVYGSQVACYSGRGGEVWDGTAWMPRGKETLKEAFRKGEEVKILLCTEAASEGLNLQTCGVLINFDMPWNPMRVEQRIGRIDRIGQVHKKVWIRNYFYEETVEAVVYRRLGERIRWFETVVGELQPILHRVGRSIEELAMLGRTRREAQLEDELRELERLVDERRAGGLDLDAYLEEEVRAVQEEPPPVTLQQIEATLVGSRAVGSFFSPHPTISGAHRLRWKNEEVDVTFSPEVFDRHPYTVQLLSYGNPILGELLAAGAQVRGSEAPEGVGLFHAHGPTPVSLFVAREGGEGVRPVSDLVGYQTALRSDPGEWTAKQETAAYDLFQGMAERAREREADARTRQLEAERLALKEAARQVLLEAALLELVETEHGDLFAKGSPTPGFGPEVVQALARHGAPFKGLLFILAGEELEPHPTDPRYHQLRKMNLGQRNGRREALRQMGMEVLGRWVKADKVQDGSGGPGDEGRSLPFERQWFGVGEGEREKGEGGEGRSSGLP